MSNIKAIETEYKGIKFRSKLEAQWAVYFDACGADWEYEPEGFDCGDGVRYLPDFVIHNASIPPFLDGSQHTGDLWIEVKGVMDEDSENKIEYFTYGDRDTRLQRFKEEVNKRFNNEKASLPVDILNLCTYPVRPLLVVGRIPGPSDLAGYVLAFTDWVYKYFRNEEHFDPYSYNLRTVNGDLQPAFPYKREEGGLYIEEPVCAPDDLQGTLSALHKARNYRFDHRRQKSSGGIYRAKKN